MKTSTLESKTNDDMLREIHELLIGEGYHKDRGLINEINKNSNFREKTVAVLGANIVATIVGVVTFLGSLFIRR